MTHGIPITTDTLNKEGYSKINLDRRILDIIEHSENLSQLHNNLRSSLGDEKGRKGFSAMYPKVRNKWTLYKAYEEEKKEHKKEQQNDKVAENIESAQTNQQNIENHKSNNETKAKKKRK